MFKRAISKVNIPYYESRIVSNHALYCIEESKCKNSPRFTEHYFLFMPKQMLFFTKFILVCKPFLRNAVDSIMFAHEIMLNS